MVAQAKFVAKVAKMVKESTNAKKGRIAKALGENVAKAVVAKVKTIVTKYSESESVMTHDVIESVLALKKKKKVKIGTHAETKFDCPNPYIYDF